MDIVSKADVKGIEKEEKSAVPCCPPLAPDNVCDIIDFRNRLRFPSSVRTEAGAQINVEVILHTRMTRCSGPLSLGDLVYSTTLLPGEKVRLATTDRRSRFSFDSETNLSWHTEQISEEQYHMRAIRSFMFDASATDQGSARDAEQGSWDFHGDADGSLGFFSASANASARGSHNAQSTRDYLDEHKQHASSSDNQAVDATRMAHSMSIGEVSTRTHTEGQSEDHFESSSREFSNPNSCHAITFLFYRINKTQTMKFSLEAIERRVLDPVAPSQIVSNPFKSRNQISVISQAITATRKNRLEVESTARQSVIQNVKVAPSDSATGQKLFALELGDQQPLNRVLREQVLKEVDAQLVAEGLLDKVGGQVSDQAKSNYSFDHQSSLPTAGVIVKGCLDDCNVCEKTKQQEIALNLEHKRLENELLKKQIELLEKSQEYRCCPQSSEPASTVS
jgi:hypothetical protein